MPIKSAKFALFLVHTMHSIKKRVQNYYFFLTYASARVHFLSFSSFCLHICVFFRTFAADFNSLMEIANTEHKEKPAVYKETIPSMLRRCKEWDYKGRGIYMLTLVVRDRQPLLGTLAGDTENAYIDLSNLGKAVNTEVEGIPSHFPQIRVLGKQVMPDHLHMLLFVQEPIPVHLTSVITGFKFGCNRHYWNSLIEIANTKHPDITNHQRVSCAAEFKEAEKKIGFWDDGYHDRILFHDGQLDAMIRYMADNPRRLALKRANPDLFRLHRQTLVGGIACTTLGNIFLADYPQRAVLQCSRSLSPADIAALRDECLAEAANGTIYITAAISEGEKTIAHTLREAGYPLIILLENGFPKPDDPHYKYFKPQGVYFEACAAGRLLLVEPSPALLDRPDIAAQVTTKAGDLPHTSKRYRFLALNALAAEIAR